MPALSVNPTHLRSCQGEGLLRRWEGNPVPGIYEDDPTLPVSVFLCVETGRITWGRTRMCKMDKQAVKIYETSTNRKAHNIAMRGTRFDPQLKWFKIDVDWEKGDTEGAVRSAKRQLRLESQLTPVS